MSPEEEKQTPSAPTSETNPSPPPALPSSPPPFDPSRMIGIIKRKALTKELAAVYHTECLAYCQELSQLQKKWEESLKSPGELRKETGRPSKRVKKGHR